MDGTEEMRPWQLQLEEQGRKIDSLARQVNKLQMRDFERRTSEFGDVLAENRGDVQEHDQDEHFCREQTVSDDPACLLNTSRTFSVNEDNDMVDARWSALLEMVQNEEAARKQEVEAVRNDILAIESKLAATGIQTDLEQAVEKLRRELEELAQQLLNKFTVDVHAIRPPAEPLRSRSGSPCKQASVPRRASGVIPTVGQAHPQPAMQYLTRNDSSNQAGTALYSPRSLQSCRSCGGCLPAIGSGTPPTAAIFHSLVDDNVVQIPRSPILPARPVVPIVAGVQPAAQPGMASSGFPSPQLQQRQLGMRGRSLTSLPEGSASMPMTTPAAPVFTNRLTAPQLGALSQVGLSPQVGYRAVEHRDSGVMTARAMAKVFPAQHSPRLVPRLSMS
eukprot:TRINITY_DN28553_c0_g1_i1.p1 TRINITY_DN28553_c0_g1~~TRINITY_DN28553_c0_g1_i1.p1  ORF type:complete len:403 (-),score=62.49 TRINITY_DN28553_c0_g1_i1:51-1220(-)